MAKQLTQETAVAGLVEVHGSTYEYSLVKYIATKEKIDIICARHGVFKQRYSSHKKGQGCPKCLDIVRKYNYDPSIPSVYGVGFKPVKYKSHEEGGKITKEYNLWSGMMTRAYNPKYHAKKPTYTQVTVCEDWLRADNFMDWCQTQVGYKSVGFQLDKDILQKGNTVYCPDVCIFVPPEINSQLTKANSLRGDYPIGVSWHTQHQSFMSCLRRDNKTKYLGYYDTPDKAFMAYRKAKEDYLKELADKYRDVIDTRCYTALQQYQVEITD